MNVLSNRFTILSKLSGLLGLSIIAVSSSAQTGITPMPGGGSPPMPPSVASAAVRSGVGYYFTSPWGYITSDANTITVLETPMPGGGSPPMPPIVTMETPMPGGGSPPMPPSVAVAGVVGGISIYVDGTIGYPNGDFQFTSGAYLWADGFVEYSSAPGNWVWTNYAGVIIVTTLGNVAANGLPHVTYPVLMGLSESP
jgi:hypothetical protein